MKHDIDETIPEGMMERIENRLRTHAAGKSRKRKIKMISSAAAVILLLPVSVFGIANMDWGWARGIGMAEKNGKTIKLNAIFEAEGSKVTLKDAVWENDMLLVSFSTSGKGFIPNNKGLINENGKKIDHGGGGEFDGINSGSFRFDLENDKITGQNVILKIYTIENPRPTPAEDIEYPYTITLDSSILSGGKVEIGREFETSYGLLELLRAKCAGGRTFIEYRFDMNAAVKQLSEPDSEGRFAAHDLFPKLFLKDGKGNTMKSSGRSYDPKTGTGEITLDGMPQNTDQPLSLALVCSDRIVNWELPIKIDRPAIEAIDIDRDITLTTGILQIQKLIPGSAGTGIYYKFTPAKGREDIIAISPGISITVDGEKHSAESNRDSLEGEALIKLPVDEAGLSKAVIEVLTVEQSAAYRKSIPLEYGSLQSGYELEGSILRVKRMDVKNGKTFIDLELDDSGRKFYDFGFHVRPVDPTDHAVACSVGSGMIFKDKARESELEKHPETITASDYTNTIIQKNIEVSGEYKKVELVIESLIYMDVCKDSLKVK